MPEEQDQQQGSTQEQTEEQNKEQQEQAPVAGQNLAASSKDHDKYAASSRRMAPTGPPYGAESPKDATEGGQVRPEGV